MYVRLLWATLHVNAGHWMWRLSVAFSRTMIRNERESLTLSTPATEHAHILDNAKYKSIRNKGIAIILSQTQLMIT